MEEAKPNPLGGLAAKAKEAVAREPEAQPELVVQGTQYTCRPMSNYSLGRFHFVNGTMTLTDADDVAEFDKLHKSQPPHLKNSVVKVDKAAAEARLKEILANQGQVQTGVTTSENNNPNPAGGKIDPASTDAANTGGQ
jgi:hypothetical protein